VIFFFFVSGRRRHTRFSRDWSSDVCSSDLEPSAGVAMIVEGEGGAQVALLVDAIQGQRQVVIKSLETNYQQVDGVAAATILGDGRVALILDIDALVSSTRRRASRPEHRMAV